MLPRTQVRFLVASETWMLDPRRIPSSSRRSTGADAAVAAKQLVNEKELAKTESAMLPAAKAAAAGTMAGVGAAPMALAQSRRRAQSKAVLFTTAEGILGEGEAEVEVLFGKTKRSAARNSAVQFLTCFFCASVTLRSRDRARRGTSTWAAALDVSLPEEARSESCRRAASKRSSRAEKPDQSGNL